MNRQWAPSIVFTLSVTLSAFSFAQSRIDTNSRCTGVRSDYERRISMLKLQQQNDLNDCRSVNGKNSDICRNLKERQQTEMHNLKQNRDLQLSSCIHDPLFSTNDSIHQTSSRGDCYVRNREEGYVDNDDKPAGKPSKFPPPAKIGPPETDGSGGSSGSSKDKSVYNTPHPLPITSDNGARSSGNSHSGGGSSNSGSSHSSSASSYSGGSSGSHSSGGGYSGGSSTGSSSSSHSSGGSSGGSSSGSSASAASAGSHDSGSTTKH